MKHFCFLTGLYSRYDVLMFERQGKSLVSAGYKVTYIVCDNKPNEFLDGIEIIATGFKPKNRFARFLHTRKILLKSALNVNADVYQISDPYYPDMIRDKNYIPQFLRRGVSVFYKYMMKTYLKKYDAIFIVTPWILDVVKKKWGISKSYLLTNFPRVHIDYHLSREDYLLRKDVMCYEGTVYETSRQENVFEALENLPSVHYILAGKIDDNYSWIKEMPYWKNVEFIDGFTLKDLEKIFARSTIANVFRDFGNNDGSWGVIKIFESMEAALPVLLADVPMYREMVAKYHCGICVNPNNVEQIRDAIRFLIENKEEAYQMGQNGRRAVIEEYNWEKQADVYVKILNRL